MKKVFALFAASILFIGLSAQNVDQNVISSAGGYDVSADNSISLSWTLGELVVTTVSSSGGDLILTQGFQQSKLIVEGIDINPDLGVEVRIYPNPASEILNIRFSEPLNGETLLFLSGPDGRLVFNKTMKPGVLVDEIYMQKYPSGTYFLRIQNGNKMNIYKVIKL